MLEPDQLIVPYLRLATSRCSRARDGVTVDTWLLRHAAHELLRVVRCACWLRWPRPHRAAIKCVVKVRASCSRVLLLFPPSWQRCPRWCPAACPFQRLLHVPFLLPLQKSANHTHAKDSAKENQGFYQTKEGGPVLTPTSGIGSQPAGTPAGSSLYTRPPALTSSSCSVMMITSSGLIKPSSVPISLSGSAGT